MEKLEKKIEEILDGYMPHNGACIEASFLIASEIKDIAIAFAFKARAANEVWSDDYRKPIEQLWNDFITTYYK